MLVVQASNVPFLKTGNPQSSSSCERLILAPERFTTSNFRVHESVVQIQSRFRRNPMLTMTAPDCQGTSGCFDCSMLGDLLLAVRSAQTIEDCRNIKCSALDDLLRELQRLVKPVPAKSDSPRSTAASSSASATTELDDDMAELWNQSFPWVFPSR